MDISIVIVNYNVKEFVSNLLDSIKAAQKSLDVEVFVVDNASVDGSMEYLGAKHPWVKYIKNENNPGFGKANNQAIQQATGTYTFILNPDTLIKENTLTEMFTFMENHPQYGACGCKLLNPDGTFAPESRRQEPTPLSSIGKMLGLATFFPKNKHVSGYYMNWLDEDEETDVEVLSGSCMFFRTEILHQLNGFDEQFFMYGEDIDLCKRTRQLGYSIKYLSRTSIIHYKGESTKKDRLDYVIVFNKAMFIYFEKHYSTTYSIFFRALISLGIILRASMSYAKTILDKVWYPITELIVLNALIPPLFLYRYSIEWTELAENYKWSYLVVNGLFSLFYILLSIQQKVFSTRKYNIFKPVSIVVASYALISLVTFFFRDFAFSRFILIVGVIVSAMVVGLLRWGYRWSQGFGSKGIVHKTPIILVGLDKNTPSLIRKIKHQLEWNYDILGIIAQNEVKWTEAIQGIPVLGRVKNINELIEMHQPEQVFFSAKAISNDHIIRILTALKTKSVITKVVPESMDYMIGKSHVEYFEDVPVLDVELAYQQPLSKFTKRSFDLFLSGFILILGFPITLLTYVKLWSAKKKGSFENITLQSKHTIVTFSNHVHPFWKHWSLIGSIWTGKMSFVGAPINRKDEEAPYYYKEGITGLRQLMEKKDMSIEEKQKYEIHYLRSYSLWMDIQIIIQSIF